MSTPSKRSEKLLSRFGAAQAAPAPVIGIAGAGSLPRISGSADPEADASKELLEGAPTIVEAPAPGASEAAGAGGEGGEGGEGAENAQPQTPADPPLKTAPSTAPKPVKTRAQAQPKAPLPSAPAPVEKKATTSLGTTYFVEDLEVVGEIVHTLVARHKLKHPLRAKIGHSVVVSAIVHSVLPTWESDPDKIVAMVNAYFRELAPAEAPPVEEAQTT